MTALITVIALIVVIALIRVIRESERRRQERSQFRHITGAPRWWGKEEEPWRYEDYPARR